MTQLTPEEFMAHGQKPLNANSPWGARYAATLRQVVADAAARAPRSLQRYLGPSELGHPCDRQVAAKMAGLPVTNHIMDPWPSFVGTAIHAALADAFRLDNKRRGLRWVPETRVTPHPNHPGTADLYDGVEQCLCDHKGVHTATPVPTPAGWSTMGSLRVGDEVFGSNGHVCHVTKVYPVQYRDCYRIKFTDQSHIIVDDIQELPFVVVRKGKHLDFSMGAAEAVRHVRPRENAQRQLRLYNGAALELPERDLLVHPYVLGCWLGDGATIAGTISKPDDELYRHISACGYTISAPYGERKLTRNVYGLTTQLQTLGLQWVDTAHPDSHRRLTGVKRIPAEYLRASADQRLALLQGLMDTDGTWNRPRKQAVFTTTDKGLAEGVAELVTSLGWKPAVLPQQAHGFGLTVTAYHVPFTPFGANPFRLSRKRNLVRISGSLTAGYRMVRSITPVPSVPTRCIDVDSPDRLYRCGSAMLPVHNCLGTTTMNKLKLRGPGRQYLVQLLLYARGYRLVGLPVRRIVLAAWPRTGSSLYGLYVWEHELVASDDDLIAEVFTQTAQRRIMAELLAAGRISLAHIPAVPEDCQWCPVYRPESRRDGGFGCPGDQHV